MADEEPAPGQPDPDLNAELFGSDDDDDQQQLQPNDQQPDGAQDITGAGDSAPGQDDDDGQLYEPAQNSPEREGTAPEQQAADAQAGEYQPGEEEEDWVGARHDEATEVPEGAEDELDAMFKKKKRRRDLDHTEKRRIVDNLLAQMEVAAELDMEDNSNQRPALNKLRHLPEVVEVMTKRDLHDDLLDSGVLGVLKSWLEPLPDGNLPNVKVRTSILKLLLQLNFFFEDRKEQLKKSGLGHVIMFLSKVPDELASNRRMAKEIVAKWSRPIFDQHRSERHEEAAAEQEADELREQLMQQPAPEDPAADKLLRPKDKGFRYSAQIPKATKLNFKRQPANATSAEAVQGTRSKAAPLQSDRMVKKLNDLSKRSKQTGRAVKISVQGKQ